MAILKIMQANGLWAEVEDPTAIKYTAQNLSDSEKLQARTNIDAAAPSEITSQVTTLSNQLYDENYGTESGMSIRYIAGQVVNNKSVSLSKGTRKDDLDFTYINGAWDMSPVGNYYGSVTTPITVDTYAFADWIIKGIELADGGCQQTLISGDIKLSRRTNTDNTWTAWKDEAIDNKLDRSVATGLYRAYGINEKGEQTMWSVQSSLNTTGTTGYIARYMTKSSFGDTKPTYDNATLITGDPSKPYHVANKNYVDATFVNKTGDTITGDLTITGNLQVKGISETVDAVTYKVENNLIEFNPDKTYNNTWLTGIAVNKGTKDEVDLGTYGIMYDPGTDSVKLGFGTISENHTFDFNENESAPIATREEFDDSWEDDAIFVFDKTTKSFKYSGKTLSSFKEDIQDEMKAYIANYIEIYMSTVIEENEASGETLDINTDNYTEENGTLIIGG